MKKPTKRDIIEEIILREKQKSTSEIEIVEEPSRPPINFENQVLLSADLRRELVAWMHSHHP